MHYVQVVSGPFACRVEFEGRLADNPTILGAAPVWHRFVGQPVENLLSWLVGKHGGGERVEQDHAAVLSGASRPHSPRWS